jgi:hypothetical protein
MNNINENSNWKVYHVWCGADRSLNNPLPNARYLITSNSLYISLQTTISKKPRFFKIRYKSMKLISEYFHYQKKIFFLLVVPSTARSYYNSDGIIFDSITKEHTSFELTSTTIIPTTIIIPSMNNSDVKNLNGTIIKRTSKKG